jgi:hypothetical protein
MFIVFFHLCNTKNKLFSHFSFVIKDIYIKTKNGRTILKVYSLSVLIDKEKKKKNLIIE